METQIQNSIATLAEQPSSGKCRGMALDPNNKLIRCPETTPAERQSEYHSDACSQWTRNRLAFGWKVDDVYVKGKRIKPVRWKPCAGWTIRVGLLVMCGGSRTDSASRKYHQRCRRWMKRWEELGYILGDRMRCNGMVLDAENKLIRCPEFLPTHRVSNYHSRECSQWTRNRLGVGWELGDVYVKGKNIKAFPWTPCAGWTIRDGVIVVCGERRDAANQKDHQRCPYQMRRWAEHGYKAGDCIKHPCGYRNCRKGEGRTKGTVEELQLTQRGSVFCTPSCAAAESAARKTDRTTAKLVELEMKLAEAGTAKRRGQRGRTKGRGDTLEKRIALAAAFRKLEWSQRQMSDFVYSDTPQSAYANTRNLFADHRSEIEERSNNQSVTQAKVSINRVGAETP